MNKVKWTKGSDFIDNTPTYTFEGRDPQTTLSDISVLIYTQRERKYDHDSSSVKNFYYGVVSNSKTENSDTIGRFEKLSIAKKETLNLFNQYCELFPNDTEAW